MESRNARPQSTVRWGALMAVLITVSTGAPASADLLWFLGSPTPTASPKATPTPTPTPLSTQNPSPSVGGLRTITGCDTRLKDSVQLGSDLVSSSGSCLVARASGITIDGNGHRISVPNGYFAIQWNDQSDITVKNVVSDQGIQIYGANANRNVVENSTFGTVGIYMGDDNVVRDSKMGALRVRGLNSDPPLRTVVTGNTIEGPGWSGILVYLSPNDDGVNLCARSDSVLENNYIHDTAAYSSTANDQVLLYLRCGSFNTVVGNTMVSQGKARGIYMRDEADDNLIQDNVVWVNNGDRSAFHFSSGNDDKHHPRNNTIDHNVFRADATRSVYIESNDFRYNLFTRNLFWSNSAEGARISGGTGNVFDHNTFVNRAVGTMLVLDSFQAPGNTYTNNIFEYSGKDSSQPLYNLSGQFDLGGYHGNNNVFFNRLGPALFDDGSGWTLSYWQQKSVADASSIEANPLFVDESDGDFQLDPNSPASSADSGGMSAGAFSAAGTPPRPSPPGPSKELKPPSAPR